MDNFKVLYVSKWKDEVSIYCNGYTEGGEDLKKKEEFSLGKVKIDMFMRHLRLEKRTGLAK